MATMSGSPVAANFSAARATSAITQLERQHKEGGEGVSEYTVLSPLGRVRPTALRCPSRRHLFWALRRSPIQPSTSRVLTIDDKTFTVLFHFTVIADSSAPPQQQTAIHSNRQKTKKKMSLSRNRLGEERKLWRKDHPYVTPLNPRFLSCSLCPHTSPRPPLRL